MHGLYSSLFLGHLQIIMSLLLKLEIPLFAKTLLYHNYSKTVYLTLFGIL